MQMLGGGTAVPRLPQGSTTRSGLQTMVLLDRSPPLFAVTLTDRTAQDAAQPLPSDLIAIGTTPIPDHQTTSLWRMEKCTSQPLGGARARSRACND
jgi:hypothetical protein